MKENSQNTDNIETRPKLIVKIEKGEATQTEYEFTDSFQIGRSETCQVKIFNDTISRFHVEVYYKHDRWWVKDLQSSNGTFIDGESIQERPILKTTKIELGINGPLVSLEVEEKQEADLTSLQEKRSMTQYMRKYFVTSDGEKVGEHTMMIRRTFQLIQKKQQKKYFKVIAIIIFLCLVLGAYAVLKHLQVQQQIKLAKDIFYNMKALEVKLAQLEVAVSKETGTQLLEQIQNDRKDHLQMEDTYNKLVVNLGIYKKRMGEEERIILRIARIFGECEINMPPGFVNEVQNYIKKWQSTNRYVRAIRRAQDRGFVDKIVNEMLNHHLPPQFFYLALQESDFDSNRCGPGTKHGIAKGIWQFIPETALEYDLRVGPLFEIRRPDPRDERHNCAKSTNAAARYIRYIYATDAQASGLLVIASYNWGEDKVINLIQRMPQNPRERNFWKLLENYHDKLPLETYDYVFYIVSAAVIGENPRLFGFKFDNPLQEAIKKFGG